MDIPESIANYYFSLANLKSLGPYANVGSKGFGTAKRLNLNYRSSHENTGVAVRAGTSAFGGRGLRPNDAVGKPDYKWGKPFVREKKRHFDNSGTEVQGTVGARTDDEIEGEAALMWPRLRNCRIFDVGPEAFAMIYHGSDVYTTEKIAKVDWSLDPQAVTDMSKEESMHHYHSIVQAGKKAPFPEHLPFDFCLFTYGEGIRLTKLQAHARLGLAADTIFEKASEIRLVSHLVCHDGLVWQMFTATLRHNQGIISFYRMSRNKFLWDNPYNLDPWVIPALVTLVNQNISVTEEKQKFSHRMMMQKASKKAGFKKPIPAPYYPLVLNTELVNNAVSETHKSCKERRAQEWRHDVRGHWRMRIKRGPLPIDEKTLKKLNKCGYEVLTAGQVPYDIALHLNRRNMNLRKEGEWIAWKLTWINDHVSPSNPDWHIP